MNNFRPFAHADKPLSTHWQGTSTKKIKSRWQYAVLALVLLLSLLGGLYFYHLNSLGNKRQEVFKILTIAQSDLKLIDNKFPFDIETPNIKDPIIPNNPIQDTPVAQLLKEKEFVFFGNKKTDLDSSNVAIINTFLGRLENLCNQLKRETKQTIKINLLGRASSTGSAKYNKSLSEKRVDAVKNNLNAQIKTCFFVEAVSGEGKGTSDYISAISGKTQEESNRSVEITVTEVK